MRSIKFAAAFLVFLVLCANALRAEERATAPKTENVFLVLVDGLRWQEVFSGAEESLMNKENGAVANPDVLKTAYWRDTGEERRRVLLPFFWEVVATQGQVFGNQNKDSVVRLANPHKFSYPGYSEMTVGFADPRIDSNDKKPNPNVTVFEWLNGLPGFKGHVAALGMWDVLPYILNRERCGFFVSGGLEPVPDAPIGSRYALLNELKAEIPARWGGEAFDALMFRTAMEYVREHKPRAMYITFGETDSWAHEGRYADYLNAARRTDGFIRELWDTTQALPEYRDKTTLIVVCDHGRGSGPQEWRDHGAKVVGAENVWIAVLGPDTPALGERANTTPLTLAQVAATVAAALGQDYCAAQSQAAPPITEAIAGRPGPALAKPTPQQAAWHDYEIGMFIHFAPNTWTDQEYDDNSLPLEKFNPAQLDTEQWVTAAEALGAKYIMIVAKHAGGFCLWPTDTTAYSVKSTPWRNGKGDVLADLAASCRMHGMKLGVYLSPADRKHGADVGGKCATPEAQECYNQLYRRQLVEVLSRYGEMFEVWFDGSNVVPVADILETYAPRAMVFQGPRATIRWVGNEDGVAPYPAWNALSAANAKSGEAMAEHGDPNGDAWLPNECDARMRNTWFWNTHNASTLKSVDQLMDMYCRSVGHGAVLLLNQTPDPSGLIPATDVQRGAEFGAEVTRRFGTSIAETAGKGAMVELALSVPRTIDFVVTMEDITQGERVREYVIEGLAGSDWQPLAKGTAIGHKKIDIFAPVTVSRVRLRVLKSGAEPVIRKLAAYDTASAK